MEAVNKLTPAIVAFAKNPEQEPVKTRLAASLGQHSAKLVYEALLHDCLNNLKNLPGLTRYIACSTNMQHRYFQKLAQEHSASLRDQVGSDLGSRMLNCVDSLSRNHSPVIIVGTDSPILPVAEINCAIANSTDWDVLLGPTVDGGYYLIAMSKPIPEVFAKIKWSSTEVFKETKRNCTKHNLRIRELPEAIDVDDSDSLLALKKVLTTLPNEGNSTRKAIALLNI